MVALEKALAAMGRDSRIAAALPGNTHKCNALEQRCSASAAGDSDDETRGQQGQALSGDASDLAAHQSTNACMLPRRASEETGEIQEPHDGADDVEQYDGADGRQDDLTEPITMMIRSLVLLRCFFSRALQAKHVPLAMGLSCIMRNYYPCHALVKSVSWQRWWCLSYVTLSQNVRT